MNRSCRMEKNVFFILIVLLVSFSGCSNKKGREEKIRTVRIDTVRVYGENKQVIFPGKVLAASDINLAFRVSGPLLSIPVEAGAFVRKGQVVARIDPRDYETQLAATEAEYKGIKGEVERIIALYEKGSISPNDHEKAVAALKQITAKYEAHQNALNDTRLRAPFDGYIQKKMFQEGETIGAGMAVLSMISSGIPEVEINIPANDFVMRDNFNGFECTLDIFPDRVYTLELVGVNQKANLNQLYTMRLRFASGQEKLPAPGMTTLVTIQYKPEKTEMVSVPVNALFEKEGAACIWVYNPSKETVSVRKVQVVNMLPGGLAVFYDGIVAGDLVVTAGVHSLEDGQKVKLLPAVSSTNVGGVL